MLPASSPADRRAAEVAVLAVTVLWAGNFIVVKGAVGIVPPVAFTFVRFTLAAATLLVVLRWREGSVSVPRRDLVPLLVLGAIGFGVYQILWTTALQTVSAGDSALLIAAAPVFTPLFAVVAGSDVLTAAKLAGALISLAGVAVVIGGGVGLSLAGSLVGDLVTLGAAACWALYTAFGAPILRRHSPLRATTWALVSGTVVLAPLGLVQAASFDWSLVGPAVVGAVAYASFLSAGIPNVVVFHGVKLLGPTRITAYQFLVPAIAVVLAAIFLAEPILPAQILGGAVIVAGILLTRSGRLGMPLRGQGAR